MTSPHTGEDSIHKPRSCHHQVSSVTVSKQFSPEYEAFPGYAEAKNATNSTHTPCRPGTGYRSPLIEVQARSTVVQRPCQRQNGNLEHGLVAYVAFAEGCLDQ
jgi:hypothetical protein